jgi:hypothetical protein
MRISIQRAIAIMVAVALLTAVGVSAGGCSGDVDGAHQACTLTGPPGCD